MNTIQYPDSGNTFEDASLLRNAVYFSTAARAYSAQFILNQPLNVSQRILDFLTIKAFEEFMTSTEDLLGWLFTLEEWQPGNPEFSLFILLNKIKVGAKDKKNNYTEERAVSILSGLDKDGFRQLFHIPTDKELVSSGYPGEFISKINHSIPFKLDGWQKFTSNRAEQDRGRVHMFNKFKHHMLAFPTTTNNSNKIWLPTSIKYNKTLNFVSIGQGWLESSANELRELVGNSIGAQAVLHDTLALILITRYREQYITPQWLIDAYQTDYILRQ